MEEGTYLSKRIIIGSLLIFIGIGFLLQQAGFIEFTSLIKSYWPVIFIIIGLLILFNRSASSKVTGWIFIVVGALLTLNQWYEFNFASLILPMILIIIGLMFIFSKMDTKKIDLDDDIESVSFFQVRRTVP